MATSAVSKIKRDEYHLPRLNKLLNHFLLMINEISLKISCAVDESERKRLEDDRDFFLEECAQIRAELNLNLHKLGFDRKGDWIVWRGKLRRNLILVNGKKITVKQRPKRKPARRLRLVKN